MALAPGRRFGPYEIAAMIGAGGMGEVYRARDTKLRRDVAIKVLPSNLACDSERLRRFEREAQVLASLNHPNIAAIYGFEEVGTTAALVLELVEGATLEDRITRGPLPVDEAMAIARQISDALETAHERGIVHRDLKPANVKLTGAGTVKVLDFGLAKALTGEFATDPTSSPTITAIATREGVIAGTAPYMSPEQARGRPVDKRSDIWAFGCVLYELLAGARAFPGETTTDVLSAVITREPDWSALPPSTPASIRRLLARCLAKDPKGRLRDIGDARIEIDDAFAAPAPATAGHSGLSRGRTIALVAGVALAAAVLAFIAGRRAIAPSTVSSNVRVHRLTDWTGLEDAPAISPDGRWLAFVSNVSGSRQIWVRLMAGGAPLQLTRDAADHRFPRWSADSNGILFYSAPVGDATSGAVWEASALGGPPRRVAGSIGEADVSPDGRSIAFFRFEGGRVELTVATRDGSNARAIAQLDTGYSYLTPRWSPDARQVAYHRTVTSVGDLFIVEAGGGTPRQVTRDATVQQGFAWSPDGSRIIFSSARGATIRYLPSMNLWSIRPDGGDLRQLTFGEISYTSPDISRSGAIVASRLRVQSDVWRIPVDGDPRENAATAVRVTRQTSQVHTPSIAPDGREVAYVSDGGSHGNIWVHSLATGESRRITDEQDPELMVGLPLWSPTQAHIAYFTALRDSLNYWVLSPDGSNRRMLAPQAGWATWSPDGRWLYYSAQPSWKQLKKTPVDGGDAIVVRSDTATRPALSPDGGTLYYVIELPIWTGGSDYEIRTATPETSEGRVLARIPDHRAALFFHPVISPDGRWLAVALVDEPANNLWAISTATGELKQITDFGHRATSIVRRVSWTPDGKSIYAAIGDLDTDIVLLDGLQAR